MATEPDSPGAYRDALLDALEDDGTSLDDTHLLRNLSLLVERARGHVPEGHAVAGALATLDGVARAGSMAAALTAAATAFATPDEFEDAVCFARCLERDAEGASSLQAARLYVAAVLPPLPPQLSGDRDAVLHATRFTVLWRSPGSLDWMLGVLREWQREYIALYLPAHASFNADLAAITERVEGFVLQVRALEALNSIRLLGAAMASAAIARFREIERLFACHLQPDTLRNLLLVSPRCPECNFAPGQEAPYADLRQAMRSIESGLAGQKSRLAHRLVSRLLRRPFRLEDRLDLFARLMQVSNLDGLELVMDDGLVEFLRELLDGPAAEPDVFSSIARAYPEITAANVGSAVEEFRRLLESALARGGGRYSLTRGDAA